MCSSILEVKGQRSRSPGTKNVLSAVRPHPALVRMVCPVAVAAPADERICWRAMGDIRGGVQRGSELGTVASNKPVWWDLRIASLLTHKFVSLLVGQSVGWLV